MLRQPRSRNPYTDHRRAFALDLDLPTTNLIFWGYGGNGSTQPSEVGASGDGQAISNWDDKSTSAYHVTNTGSARPTYDLSASVGNLRGGAVFASASSQYLNRAAAGLIDNLNVYTIAIVLATTSTAIQTIYSTGAAGANPITLLRLNNGATNRVDFAHRSDSGTIASGQATVSNFTDGNLKLIVLRRSASNAFSLRVNGVEIATSTNAPGTTTTTNFVIGARFTSGAYSQYTNGTIFTAAMYSSDNYTTIEPILTSFYGVS